MPPFHYLINAWIPRLNASDEWKTSYRVIGLTTLVLGLWVGWGNWTLERIQSQIDSSPNIRIGLAQGNIEQHLKWNKLYQRETMEFYKELTLQVAKEKPELIVWPEAATPFYYGLDPTGTKYVQDLARTAGVPLLFGSPYKENVDGKFLDYNRAFLISTQGETIDVYDKMHLVPFGEFVPFRKALFFIEKMVEIIGDFGLGKRATVFELNGSRFGSVDLLRNYFPRPGTSTGQKRSRIFSQHYQ